jgi:hypothetical protein
MGSRIRSYCTAGDPFCDVGNPLLTDANAHLTYVEDYGEGVISYVVEQYKNGGLSNGSSGQDSAATSTAARQQSARGRQLFVLVAVAAFSSVAFLIV